MTNFLLVLGTQKCGTTWISNQLRSHSQHQSCAIKEWRALTKAISSSMQVKDYSVTLSYVSENYWHSLNKNSKRLFASANLDNYLSVQKSSLTWKHDQSFKSVGDITGANGLMDIELLRFFAQHAQSVGFNIKPMFIMRDPVERHFSAAKMKFNNTLKINNQVFNKDKHVESLNQYVLDALLFKSFINRTKYELVIPKIEDMFSKSNILYLFSENLLQEKAIDKVTDYLGLKRFDDDGMNGYPKSLSNESRIKHILNENIRQKIRESYSSTYIFTRNHFGSRIPKSWL
jgi:hypothetical protein|tara:strand:+ start:243 stop:1106 length:864 start_codon:yes stop_codon:yes gene_type:complete